jgi:hypothetical protein
MAASFNVPKTTGCVDVCMYLHVKTSLLDLHFSATDRPLPLRWDQPILNGPRRYLQ